MFIFSISGENEHYSTPTNPAAPSRTPGGSSSGAAVAVAANLVDFSLGELHLFLILFKVLYIFFTLPLDICYWRCTNIERIYEGLSN